MTTQLIPPADLQAAFAIKCEYLDDQPFDKFSRLYQTHADLFVGLYLDDRLIGLCYGWPFAAGGLEGANKIILQGIAVIEPYNAKGRGGLLLRHFEEQVAKRGRHTISVGSAGGYVEGFYQKNGYHPHQYMARIDRGSLPATTDLTIDGHRDTDSETIVYLPAPTYDPERKALIKESLKAHEVIFIFEKQV
ncbi:MAG: GNAT family N-acetyltransferase [Candidatus Latescibacteria bacterium]|nr:GNAT family N-acetyltransferase [Candidatus Latescibacterota bacterium]